MKSILFWVLLVTLVGCASGSYGVLITPEQVAWIKKGVTTREEVLARLGNPNMPEVPDVATLASMEYESTSIETIEEGKKVTRGTLKARPQQSRTIAQYFYTHAEAVAFSGATSTSRSFWVCYEAGVVVSFGFSETALSSCQGGGTSPSAPAPPSPKKD